VLELFGELGRPPNLAEICHSTGGVPEQVRAHLAELQVHDLLGIDPATGLIVYAYPFTSQATEHRVELYGRTLNALCAIDALGVGGIRAASSMAIWVAIRCPLCWLILASCSSTVPLRLHS
jgi:hypothetical protein